MPNYTICLTLAAHCEDEDAAEVLCSDLRNLFSCAPDYMGIVSVESVSFQKIDPEIYGIPF